MAAMFGNIGWFGPGIPISPPERRSVMSHISAHADYRHEDYFFNRTQSRALRALEWEHSDKPLHSWSELVYPALAAAGAVIAMAGILY
jgi:hypothetical protein